MVAFPTIAIEGVHSAKDGPKFAYCVDGRDASYMTKYNLVHLQACHNVTMESGKSKRPFTWERGPRVQILNNLLAHFVAKKKRLLLGLRGMHFWSGIGSKLICNTHLRCRIPALVRWLASNHIFQLLGMIAWGVGAILFNMQAKLECNKDLTLVIQTTQTWYAKALKGT